LPCLASVFSKVGIEWVSARMRSSSDEDASGDCRLSRLPFKILMQFLHLQLFYDVSHLDTMHQ
jgi:hypothetical protein